MKIYRLTVSNAGGCYKAAATTKGGGLKLAAAQKPWVHIAQQPQQLKPLVQYCQRRCHNSLATHTEQGVTQIGCSYA